MEQLAISIHLAAELDAAANTTYWMDTSLQCAIISCQDKIRHFANCMAGHYWFLAPGRPARHLLAPLSLCDGTGSPVGKVMRVPVNVCCATHCTRHEKDAKDAVLDKY